MKLCAACLKDFSQSEGAQSEEGKRLIAFSLLCGLQLECVPPEKCEGSSHQQIMKEQAEKVKP